MHKKICLVIALIGATLWGTAQGQDTVTVATVQTDTLRVDTTEQYELPVISYSLSPKKYTIADIKVTGVKNYDDFVLIGFSGLAVGDVVEVPGDKITDAVKRFWRHSLFSDVKVVATRIEDKKIWLEFQLKQRPRISEIHYNGVKKSEREELEQRLGLRKGHTLTPNVVDRAKTLIVKYFDGKGFKNVDVDIDQRDDRSNEGEVIVNINIDKKMKTKINEIEIIGNEALSDFTLKKAMKKTNERFDLKKRLKTSVLEVFSTKKFTTEEFENDKRLLIEKYNEYGYRDAILLSDTVITLDEKRVDIQLTVDEGDKYYIKDLQFVGNTKYPSDQLLMVLNMKPGDVYNQKKLMERLQSDEDAVSNIYYNNGYLFFYADPVEIDVHNDSITLEVRIQEGPQATINKVIISGNERVYEDVIRRELSTKPGMLFSRDGLMRSIRDLSQLQLFDPENIKPEPIPNQEDGTVDVRFNVVPKGSDQVELSMGWGPTGLMGRVSLKLGNFSMKNLFHPKTYRRGIIPQGDGETFAITGSSTGQNYQSYSIAYTDPWFGGKRPNSFSVNLYYAHMAGINSQFLRKQSERYMPYMGYGMGGYGMGGYGMGGYGMGGYGMGGYGMGGGMGGRYGGQDDRMAGIYQSAYDPDKYMRMIGATMGFGKRLNWPDDYFAFNISANYQMYRIKNWREYFDMENGAYHKFNLELSLQRSSIDNPLYTRYGSQFSTTLAMSPPYSLFDKIDYAHLDDGNPLKSRFIEYFKWKFQGKVFIPLAPLPQNNGPKRTPVFMSRVEYGLLGSYNKYKQSRFETFDMGGDGMSGYSSYYATEMVGLRGYDNSSLSGYGNNMVRYGRAYTRLTMELRYPVIMETSATIYALAFVEAGNAWGSIKEFNPFDLKRSAGAGVRFFLPMIGLMGIDWAYGFDTPAGSIKQGGSHFHFILGREF